MNDEQIVTIKTDTVNVPDIAPKSQFTQNQAEMIASTWRVLAMLVLGEY